MARFLNTISYTIDTDSAQDARHNAETVLRVGRDNGYLRDGAIVSVEAVAVPIYTQAQLDEAVQAATARALSTI